MNVILRRGASLLPGILLVLLASAQTPKSNKTKNTTTKKSSSSVSKKQSEKKVENTLLWQISGNGLKNPSYIFGTMHLLCDDDARLSDNLKKAIAQTDQIYFELDLDDMAEMMSTVKYLRMKDNVKLSDLLPAGDYERIKKYFSDNLPKMPFSMMERFKPFMLTSLISESGFGCDNTNGMELSIMSEAKKTNKEIKGLETPEYQAGLFDSIPYEEQAKELLNYIDSSDKYAKATEELVEVYKKQDLQKIEELTMKSDTGMEKYLDLLVYNRNRHWMQALIMILHTKPSLIAVGAGHLPGEDGMLSLLKKAGFTLKPINNTPPPVAKEKSEVKSS